MLTLTRKAGQRILIGDEIVIVVREVRGRQVRLGIIAPRAMQVLRDEVQSATPGDHDVAAPEPESEPER